MYIIIYAEAIILYRTKDNDSQMQPTIIPVPTRNILLLSYGSRIYLAYISGALLLVHNI